MGFLPILVGRGLPPGRDTLERRDDEILTCKNAARLHSMSMKAACIPGSTRVIAEDAGFRSFPVCGALDLKIAAMTPVSIGHAVSAEVTLMTRIFRAICGKGIRSPDLAGLSGHGQRQPHVRSSREKSHRGRGQ